MRMQLEEGDIVKVVKNTSEGVPVGSYGVILGEWDDHEYEVELLNGATDEDEETEVVLHEREFAYVTPDEFNKTNANSPVHKVEGFDYPVIANGTTVKINGDTIPYTEALTLANFLLKTCTKTTELTTETTRKKKFSKRK